MKLTEINEINESNEEQMINSIVNKIAGQVSNDPSDASLDPDNNYDEYEKYAEKIVEPLNLTDEESEYYYDMMENDEDNWAGWLSNFLGEKWGKLAKVVNEYGY